MKDKLVIIRLYGLLEKGKISDIDFPKIELFVKGKEAYIMLKSTTKLIIPENEVKFELNDSINF